MIEPELGDIVELWGEVLPGIEEILEQFPWLEWEPKDVFKACCEGKAGLHHTPDGFTISTVEIHPLTGEKSLLIWIAWAREKGLGKIVEHFDFYVALGLQLDCTRLSVKTPIAGLDKLFLDTGWRCDMRNFSVDITGGEV